MEIHISDNNGIVWRTVAIVEECGKSGMREKMGVSAGGHAA